MLSDSVDVHRDRLEVKANEGERRNVGDQELLVSNPLRDCFAGSEHGEKRRRKERRKEKLTFLINPWVLYFPEVVKLPTNSLSLSS